MFKVKYTKDSKIHTVYKVQYPINKFYITYFLIFIESNGTRLAHWEWIDADYCIPVEGE